MALGGLVGCQQHHFMTEADFRAYRKEALCGVTGADCLSPADMPHEPGRGGISTVLSPEGKQRFMTLAECLALAMENGRSTDNFETADTRRLIPAPTQGSPVGGSSDALRVFAYDPAIRAIDIEQALAKFDPFYRGNFTTSKVDRPVGTALDTFQGAFSQINAIRQDTAVLQNSIVKPLPTGGLAGISFNTDYEFSNLNARVNPSYRPVVSLSVEQPLLRGFGVGMNQLLDAHPGGIRNQAPTGGRVPGILLSRINTDEAHVEFERRVSTVCFAIEEAYWQLYAAYWDKYAREVALRQVLESWNIANAKYRAGSATLLDVRTAEVQFRITQVQLLTALGQGQGNFAPGVLEAERKLRYAMGLPMEDGTRLIPIDKPTDAPFRPDWGAAVNEALALRPDMRQIRLEIQRSQFEVLRANNLALPDIRAFANYDLLGLGNQLDGNTPANAFYPIFHNQYQNWTLGLNATFTFGGRSENSDIQRAKLQLAQRYLFLQEQEQATSTLIGAVIRNLVQLHRSIELNRAQREAAAEAVRLRYQAYRAGKETIDFLLRAQQDFANALSAEQASIANYNIALANFELQKGTMLPYDNVRIMEGPLPDCVAPRASEHLRQRMGALVVREAGTSPLFDQTGGLVTPDLPKQGTVSLKDVQDAAQALPKVPEQLKPPEEVKPPPVPMPPRNEGPVPEMPPSKN
jgi:outer membrane protein TolC